MIKNYNPQTDNFYRPTTGDFVFNNYKTYKSYGQVIINIKKMAPELYKILNKWILLNNTDYLLVNEHGDKLRVPRYTQMLNKIFGRKMSVDILRHTYITNYFENQKLPNILDMEKLAKLMGHSLSTQLEYIKNNIPA